VKQHLRSMVQNDCLPQVLIFYGPEGIGKRCFAEALSQFLLETENNVHPDFHHLRPEGKNDAHTMAGVRELIREVALPPYQAKVKVFLIHQAESLTENCQNALLKTLEEPLPATYIFLLCEEIGSLLPTILSRCCLLRFSLLSKELIIQYLDQKQGVAKADVKSIAAFSQGSLAKALQLVEKREDKATHLIRRLLSKHLFHGLPGWHDLLLEIDGLDEQTRDDEALFEEIFLWFRDLHLVQEKSVEGVIYHQESKKILEDQAKTINLLQLGLVHDILCEAHQALKAHVRLRHVLEATLLKLSNAS